MVTIERLLRAALFPPALALCPICKKEWTMPEQWKFRCRAARRWKLQGKVFRNICPECEKKTKKIKEVKTTLQTGCLYSDLVKRHGKA